MQNVFLDNTAIEIHREIQTGNIRHVVFDFDGTISLIRDGWQNVMVPMMIECLQTETDTTETEAQLEALVVEFVDRLTGKQTIYQMIQLSEEIEKRGGAPKEPLAYKDEYNRRLLPIVEERIAGLAAGTLPADPLRVPMSLEFLQTLREMGISCYLASGTDVEFVKNEATLLGVAEYFDGGNLRCPAGIQEVFQSYGYPENYHRFPVERKRIAYRWRWVRGDRKCENGGSNRCGSCVC